MEDTTLYSALAGLLYNIDIFAKRAGHNIKKTDISEHFIPYQWRNGVQTYFKELNEIPLEATCLAAGQSIDNVPQSIHEAVFLQSIFQSISLDGRFSRQPSRKYVLPLKTLSDTSRNTIFPIPEPTSLETNLIYHKLWANFSKEVQSLRNKMIAPIRHQKPFLCSLLNLLQKYTWAMPCSYNEGMADISFYDHSRMTAALAVCLANKPKDTNEVAILVGGNISGIQEFVYTITSYEATRNLRGRSVYVQLLTESITRYVLHRLGLPMTNLIYMGGGIFYILAPVTKSSTTSQHLTFGGERQMQTPTLDEISPDITQRLLKIHDGELHLVMGHTLVSKDEFQVGKFHETWHRLSESLHRNKLQPLISLPDDMLTYHVGSSMGTGGNGEYVCDMCGMEAEHDNHDTRICGFCHSLTEFGDDLAQATHLITCISDEHNVETRKIFENVSCLSVNHWQKGLEMFGANVWVVNADVPPTQSYGYMQVPYTTESIEVVDINPKAKFASDLYAELDDSSTAVMTSPRPFAQLVPIVTDRINKTKRPITFDELSHKAIGNLKRWGILRLDMDNLSEIYKWGFETQNGDDTINRLTLSHVANLSFALQLFFEGYLPQIGPDSSRLKNRLYVQYAGGDDSVVVGSWDALPEFAFIVQEEFKRYVSYNPQITLSGGINLATINYPFHEIIAELALAERAAKSFTRHAFSTDGSLHTKNAFTIFGESLSWETFIHVMRQAYRLAIWCSKDITISHQLWDALRIYDGDSEDVFAQQHNQVSHVLLENLLSIYLEYQQRHKESLRHEKWSHGQIYFGPWMWHLAHALTRRIKNDNIPLHIQESLENMEKRMLENQTEIETIGLSVLWAKYLIWKK